jgi:hypothetical protein
VSYVTYFTGFLPIIFLLLLTSPCPEGNMMTVNSRFGSVSNRISKVIFNIKPFVIVKSLDFHPLQTDNLRLKQAEEAYKARVWTFGAS